MAAGKEKILTAYSLKSFSLLFNADWRDFQNTPAKDEIRKNSILMNDYLDAMHKSGWEEIQVMWAPMSSERFHAGVVAAMQKKKILGVTNRYVIVAKKQA